MEPLARRRSVPLEEVLSILECEFDGAEPEYKQIHHETTSEDDLEERTTIWMITGRVLTKKTVTFLLTQTALNRVCALKLSPVLRMRVSRAGLSCF